MIDRHVLPLQRRLLQPLAAALVRLKVKADMITLVGFLIGLLAVPLLAAGWFLPALTAILVNRMLDGLDGAVARITQPTDRGAFMDIAFDFFFYAAIPLGFALADPGGNALAAATLILAYVGTGSSFLAFAVIAAKRGLSAEDYPQKTIYYLGGLAEGAETIAVMVAMCLFPSFFAEIAYVFAAICLATAITRWWQGVMVFNEEKPGTAIRTAANTRPTEDHLQSRREYS